MNNSARFLYSADSFEGQLIKNVLKAKQLHIFTEVSSGTKSKEPQLSDHGTTVIGTIPILEYLEDKYPHPCLNLLEPNDKALVRMFVNRTISTMYTGFSKISELNALLPVLKQNKFVVASKLTFADLALLPIIPKEKIWDFYRKAIEDQLRYAT